MLILNLYYNFQPPFRLTSCRGSIKAGNQSGSILQMRYSTAIKYPSYHTSSYRSVPDRQSTSLAIRPRFLFAIAVQAFVPLRFHRHCPALRRHDCITGVAERVPPQDVKPYPVPGRSYHTESRSSTTLRYSTNSRPSVFNSYSTSVSNSL